MQLVRKPTQAQTISVSIDPIELNKSLQAALQTALAAINSQAPSSSSSASCTSSTAIHLQPVETGPIEINTTTSRYLWTGQKGIITQTSADSSKPDGVLTE